MTNENLTPQKAANRISLILKAINDSSNISRFPVNVKEIALEAAKIFHWDDPIATVQAADIKKFEGALHPNEKRTEWLLLYNSSLKSQGRILFSQAHELGHYILHRQQQEFFNCSPKDMLWSSDEINIEYQADIFSSYLLMPLDDFRAQLPEGEINLDLLSICAKRYGVSLIAAILKWLEYTTEKAVLIIAKDGFIDWAKSSESALKAGAFFKTKNNIIPLPEQSLANNPNIAFDRTGTNIPANIWFEHANRETHVREMKIQSEQYNFTISLLLLPHYESVWPPWVSK